jgi:hypothetical protein
VERIIPETDAIVSKRERGRGRERRERKEGEITLDQ